MYDYNNGRFLSVDPFIQNPGSTQSLNPYTYIFNNPLSGTDPSGYTSCGDNKDCKIKIEDVDKVIIGEDGSITVVTTDNKLIDVTSVTTKVNGIEATLSTSSGNLSLNVSDIGSQQQLFDISFNGTKVADITVLGEGRNGENLDRKSAKLFTPFAGPLMELTELCMSEGCGKGDVAKQLSFTALEFLGAKAIQLLGKAPGFGWVAKSADDIDFLEQLDVDDITKINSMFSNGLTLQGKDVSTVLFNASHREGGFNQAASIIRDIAGAHLFQNGNKRTAQTLVESLFKKSGVSGPSSSQLRKVIDQVGEGTLRDVDEIAKALR